MKFSPNRFIFTNIWTPKTMHPSDLGNLKMLTMTWNKTNSACECWFSCFTRSYAKSISSINPNGMKNEEKMQNIKMMLFREKKVHFDEKVVGKLKYMNSDWKQCLVFSSIKICTNSVWGNRPNIHESMISSKKKINGIHKCRRHFDFLALWS